MLGQGCRNASPETRQSRVDGILPRRGGGNKAEVYLPPKSLLYSLVLALAPGRLRIRFLLFKIPSSSFIHTSDQGQGNLGAGFRSDPHLLYLHQTLVKSFSLKTKRSRRRGVKKSSTVPVRFCIRRHNTWYTLVNMREESSTFIDMLGHYRAYSSSEIRDSPSTVHQAPFLYTESQQVCLLIAVIF